MSTEFPVYPAGTQYVWDSNSYFISSGGFTTTAYQLAIDPTTINKEKKPMIKYYKAIAEMPAYEVGQIVAGSKAGGYRAIDDLFTKEFPTVVIPDVYYEIGEVVENSPSFYERVYKVDTKENIQYLSKADAQAAAAAAATPSTSA